MLRTHQIGFKDFAAGLAGPGALLLSILTTTVVTENVARGEVDHGTRGLRTSRPLAQPSSSARLSELVSACLAGRPALGNDPIDNSSNVGAFDPGAVIDPGTGVFPGTGDVGGDELPIQPDDGAGSSALNEEDGGKVNGQAVFEAKCKSCHSGPGDAKFGGIAKVTLAITSGGSAVSGPPKMKTNLASLNTAEKAALLEFLGQ